MSNYKNGRMPKNKYLNLIENGYIKEKSCHKKQSTVVSRFNHGLKCSRDAEGNVLCAGCKLLLIPKNQSDDVYGKYVSKIINTGGCYNCCYDCEFSSFCNKCALNWVNKHGNYVSTCPYSFLEQIKDNSYTRGRYSRIDKDHYECLKEVFKNDLKYNNSFCGMFIDPYFLMELYKENNYKDNFRLYKNVVKNILSELPIYDTVLDLEKENYNEFYITSEKVQNKFFEIRDSRQKKSIKKLDEKLDIKLDEKLDIKLDEKLDKVNPRPEMKGPLVPSFASLFNTINTAKKLYI